MKNWKVLSALALVCVTEGTLAAGFALYEGSAYGNAVGGAVMGKGVDASANFYNPATLTDLTGTVFTVGMTTEHPLADTYIDGQRGNKMDPGCFVLPHMYFSQQLPGDFWFGLGFAPEYGLGTHYRKDRGLSWDTRKTTIRGLVLNPNLAYKVTDKWSVALGFRLMYIDFEQYSDQWAVANGSRYGTVRDHLRGDNHMIDWGWQIGSKYDLTDKLSVGVLYKSYIDTNIKGVNRARASRYDDTAVAQQVSAGVRAALAEYAPMGIVPGTAIYQQYYDKAYGAAYPTAVQSAHDQVDQGARAVSGKASATVRLPQSLTLGANYDLTDDLHLGVATTWTQWSSVDAICFDLPGDHDKNLELKWNDAWRMGFGGAYDLTENWTLMASYVYDMDPERKYYGCTMLPPGDRHIGTIGAGYSWGPIDFVMSYGLVFMNGESLHVTDALGTRHKFETKHGLSHAVAVSVTYHF